MTNKSIVCKPRSASFNATGLPGGIEGSMRINGRALNEKD